jgi:starch phosphorylase
MVQEYAERLYVPAARARHELAQNDYRAAAELSRWKSQMRNDWPQVRIEDVQIGNADRQNIVVGETLDVTARLHLGPVNPQHVRVEAYYGEVEIGRVTNPRTVQLHEAGHDGNGSYVYQGAVPAAESGTYGFSVRVLPTHPHLVQNHELRLITWS